MSTRSEFLTSEKSRPEYFISSWAINQKRKELYFFFFSEWKTISGRQKNGMAETNEKTAAAML
jgi:hypothetical protein